MSQITIEMLMEQAQVFASAWSLVDGPFDQGGQLQVANAEKTHLEDMLLEFQDQIEANAAPGNFREIAEGLIQWHQSKLKNFDTVLEAPDHAEIHLGTGDDSVVLSGELAAVFRAGLSIARDWVAKFPLSIETNTHAGDDGEKQP